MIQVITKNDSNYIFCTDLYQINEKIEVIMIFIHEKINNQKRIIRYAIPFINIKRLIIDGKEVKLKCL